MVSTTLRSGRNRHRKTLRVRASALALAVAVGATVYPARRAASLVVTDALRFQ